MAWVKLDDGFFRHPKALAAGKDGRALFLAGICWSSANLTDGHIPGAALRTVCADAEVKMTVAAVLVAAGLWEHADDGFRIHDFTVFQRSAETVKRDREAGRERAKKSKASREAQPQKRRSFDRSHTAASAALRPIEVEVDTSKPSSSVVDLETPLSRARPTTTATMISISMQVNPHNRPTPTPESPQRSASSSTRPSKRNEPEARRSTTLRDTADTSLTTSVPNTAPRSPGSPSNIPTGRPQRSPLWSQLLRTRPARRGGLSPR